jgi:hypothetical protein
VLSLFLLLLAVVLLAPRIPKGEKMRKKALAISIALIHCSVFALSSPLAQAQVSSKSAPVIKLKPSELSLEQLYRAQPYAGKAATQLRFSNDGRYLAYAWNPFSEEGNDLYIHVANLAMQIGNK